MPKVVRTFNFQDLNVRAIVAQDVSKRQTHPRTHDRDAPRTGHSRLMPPAPHRHTPPARPVMTERVHRPIGPRAAGWSRSAAGAPSRLLHRRLRSRSEPYEPLRGSHTEALTSHPGTTRCTCTLIGRVALIAYRRLGHRRRTASCANILTRTY